MRTIALLSLTTALFLAPFSFAAETVTKKFDADSIDSLDLVNQSGKVVINGANCKEAVVNAKKIKTHKNCRLTIEQHGKTLKIESVNKAWLSWKSCTVDMDITVPKKISMKLEAGSGDMTITDTEGKIKSITGSGNVAIKSSVTDLDSKVGSGDIDLTGTVDNSELKIGSGNINMKGKVGKSLLRVGSGNIEVDGLREAMHIENGSGDVLIKYSELKKDGELEIKIGSGNATVFLSLIHI